MFSKHETLEAFVLGGVALLFVVAISFIAWADVPEQTNPARAEADSVQTSLPVALLFAGRATP